MRKTIAAALALLAMSAATASANDMATWKDTGFWKIEGSLSGFCVATTYYQTSGEMMVIGFADRGVNLYVTDRRADFGKEYTFNVSATDGTHGYVKGEAITNGTIAFLGINERLLKSLARSHKITIGALGTFELKGSAEAIKEGRACLDAVNGRF